MFLPDKVFDALVMMRWAEMMEPERQQASEDALEMGEGNFGVAPLERLMGAKPSCDGEAIAEEVAKIRKAMKAKRARMEKQDATE
jgi:hypothetical protein